MLRLTSRLLLGLALTALSSTPARGDEPPAATTAPTPLHKESRSERAARADDLAFRGNDLAFQGQWAEARALYQQAWALRQSYDLAANLGFAEIEIGQYRDAAEHLAWSLDYFPFTGAGFRLAMVQEGFAEARDHVAALALDIGVEGAEVRVDGQSVGLAPLEQEIFVEAGTRTIEATAPGFNPVRTTIEAEPGESETVVLALERMAAPVTAAPAEQSTFERWISPAITLGGPLVSLAAVVYVFLLLRRQKSLTLPAPHLRRGALRGWRRRDWLRERARLSAHATARRLRDRAKRNVSLLMPSVTDALEPSDIAPLQQAVDVLYFTAPRAEAIAHKLMYIPTMLPQPKGARLRRMLLAKRLRKDVAAAEASLEVLRRVDRHLTDRGDAPPELQDAVDEHRGIWSWRVATMERLLAVEEGILATHATTHWLPPADVALLSEAVESARTSLSWIRPQLETVWRLSQPRRAQRLANLRRELAGVWWALDIIKEVEERVLDKIASPKPPSVAVDRGAFARALGRLLDTLRDTLRWRTLRHGRKAHAAICELHFRLREQAANAGLNLTEPGFHTPENPRIPPSPTESSGSGGDAPLN